MKTTSALQHRVTARRSNAGLTVIELMAVVAIVSVLALIALPAYQDYAVRTKVSEGMVFAAEAKTSVSEYFYNIRSMPTSNQQAGLPDPDDYDVHTHVRRLEIRSVTPRAGTIQITFKIPNLGTDNVLNLVPSTADNLISWECKPAETNGIAITRVPANCRGG
ncbi:MAG: pilin [Halioglobus sp.]